MEFSTSDGLVLRGRWRQTPDPLATVVIAHGFSAGRDEPAIVALADDLVGAGFSVLTYDARGHGESEGRSEVGSIEHLDVASAVREAGGGGVPVVLVGVSMGAVAVVGHLAAAGLNAGTIVGAVLVSGPAEWRMRPSPLGLLMAGVTRTPPGRWAAERWLRVRIAHGWRVGEDPASTIARVDLPVAVVHGRGDRLLDVAHAHLLHRSAGGPCRLQLVDAMAHGVDMAGRKAALDAVSWVLAEAGVSRPTTTRGR